MANTPFKGMNLGGANLAKTLMDVQKKMREDGEKMLKRLDEARLEGSAGGVIKAVSDGNGILVELTIAKEAVDPDDVETLQELILAAVRQALEKAEELRTEEQRKLMPNVPGLNFPGLF